MIKLNKNILTLIGNTPLVKINRLCQADDAEVWAKLEGCNIGGSVKDRIALSMIETAEKSGALKPGGTIIEPTSGNTGIGLAMIAAVKGYKLILTMPETMSIERRNLLKAFGAEVVLTEGSKGMMGAIERAEELVKSNKNAFMPQQFCNPANTEIHKKTTGEEIWRDTDGKVDIFIAGVGTGGTLTGVGKALKKKKPNIKIIAIEPENSAVLSGGQPGAHNIQGIGAGFVPEILNMEIVDEIIGISDNMAMDTARRLAKEEGILCGISSGATVAAAIGIAKRKENEGKLIVALVADTGERYLSTPLFED